MFKFTRMPAWSGTKANPMLIAKSMFIVAKAADGDT